MKTLVTGGTGFIGSHVIDILHKEKNAQIYALVRDMNNLKWLKDLKIQFLEGDLFSIPEIPSDIDYVFHIAGFSRANKSADYYTVNQQGTASVFQALEKQNLRPKKIIVLSSLSAAGPCKTNQPIRETDIPCPVSPYGKSKLQGELEALKYKDIFPVIIVRVGAVFGPRDRDFLPYFKAINRGILPFIASANRRASICYVKELARALLMCALVDLPSGEIFNIAYPEPYNYEIFGRAAGDILGKKLKKVKIPLSVMFFGALFSELISRIRKKPNLLNRHKVKELRQEGWFANIKKAEKLLSFKPQYTLTQALQETLNWYIEQGWF